MGILSLPANTHSSRDESRNLLPHIPAQVSDGALVAHEPASTRPREMRVKHSPNTLNFLKKPVNDGLHTLGMKAVKPDQLPIVWTLTYMIANKLVSLHQQMV